MNLFAFDQQLKNSLRLLSNKLTVSTIICLQSICARYSITPGYHKQLPSIVRDSVAYLLRISRVQSFSFLNLRMQTPSKQRRLPPLKFSIKSATE
ncbi:hypothetical protein FGO68_gene4309 [Halteria grandinella]|uniref:Uncharacterized protein n=1 Tax=Halteria grandinella TaxID=5974 RepID=A0A8J8NWU0_HALGN|nr:hypothetical protein FGO68_gene4309 [Halteria grandinella]